MPGIGDLVVNLSANTQKFDKNISKSQVGLKDFASSAVLLLNPVTASLVAMTGAAVGVGAAVWGLQGRIGDLAGVADKAAQTGLSGAFLQRLEFAADQSGVSAETLTGGIKKLTVMIGKAADGSKEASEALSSLGLSADDLKKLSPEQQFLKISQKIGEIPTAAGKAAAAVKIFGKSGIEMTGLFAGGLDDITKLMQDAKDIGIGLDDKSLAQVAEADDALQKMYASIGAMVDQVAVGLAPAFTEVSTQVTNLIGPVTKLFETFNSMEGKWSWLGDTIVAAFDVGIETIKIHWSEMLSDLLKSTADFGFDVANFALDVTNPVDMAMRGSEMAQKAGALKPDDNGLQQAQNRLADLMNKFADEQKANAANDNAPQQNQFEIDISNAQKEFDAASKKVTDFWLNDPAMKAASAALDKAVADHGRGSKIWMDADEEHSRQIQIGLGLDAQKREAEKRLQAAKSAPAKAESQSNFNSGISSMLEKIKESASGGLLSSIKIGAEGMLDRAKIQAGSIAGTLTGWLGTDRKKQQDMTPRLAGAMSGGGIDAYSTIVQAMMTRGKDPVVAAIEKQTKVIKDQKPKREFKNIESFVSL